MSCSGSREGMVHKYKWELSLCGTETFVMRPLLTVGSIMLLYLLNDSSHKIEIGYSLIGPKTIRFGAQNVQFTFKERIYCQ